MWNETIDVVIVREALGLPSARLVIVSPATGHHIRQTRSSQGLLLVFEDVIAFDPTLSDDDLATITNAQYSSSSSPSGSNGGGTGGGAASSNLSRTKIVHDARIKSKYMHCWTCSGRNSLSVRTSTEGIMLLVDGTPTFNFVEIEEVDAVVNAIRLVASNPSDPNVFKPENIARTVFPKDTERLDTLSRRHGLMKNEFVVASLYGTLITNHRVFVGTSSYILSEIPFVAVETNGTIIVTLDSVQKLVLKTSSFRQGILLRMWLESVMNKADELQKMKMEIYLKKASGGGNNNNSGNLQQKQNPSVHLTAGLGPASDSLTTASTPNIHRRGRALSMREQQQHQPPSSSFSNANNNNETQNNTNNDVENTIGSLPRMHALLALHRQFCAVSNGKGMITTEQLHQLMQPLYPDSRISESMFRFFDSDNSGEISFDEFASGMLGLLSPEGLSHYDRHRFTFSLFDANGDGHLSESEVRMAIDLMQKTGLARSSSLTMKQDAYREVVREIFLRLKNINNTNTTTTTTAKKNENDDDNIQLLAKSSTTTAPNINNYEGDEEDDEEQLTIDEFVTGIQREDIGRLLSYLGVDAGNLVRFPAARLSAELLTPMEHEWSRVAAIMHAIQALIFFFRSDPAAKNFDVKTHFVHTDYMIPKVLLDLEKTNGRNSPSQQQQNQQNQHIENNNKSNSSARNSPPSQNQNTNTSSNNSPPPLLANSENKFNNTDQTSSQFSNFHRIGLDVHVPAICRVMQQLIVGELQEFEQSFAVDDISGNLMLGSNSVPKRIVDALRPGSIRYDTQDGKYTIQSISSIEFDALVASAKKLVEHVVEFPNSYVPRYIALFTVNAPEGIEPLYFFIKQNPQPVGKFFPSIGECAVPMEGPPLSQPMMLDPGWQEVVMGQLEADLDCLCKILPYCKVILKSTVFGASAPNLHAGSMKSSTSNSRNNNNNGNPSSSRSSSINNFSNNNNRENFNGQNTNKFNVTVTDVSIGNDDLPASNNNNNPQQFNNSAIVDDATINIPRPGPLQSKVSVQTFNKLYIRDYTPATIEVAETHACCAWLFHTEKSKGKKKKDQVIAVGSLATKLRASQKALLPKKRALSDIKANGHPICFELAFLSVTEYVDDRDERIAAGRRSYLDIQDKPKGPTEHERQCLPFLRRGFVDFVRRSLGTRRVPHLNNIQLASQCIADTVVALNGTEADLTIDRAAKQLFLAWNGRTLLHSSLRASLMNGFGFFRRKHPMTYGARRELQLRTDLDFTSSSGNSFRSETLVKFGSTAALERFCEEITRTCDQVKSFVPGQENTYLGSLRVCSIVWNLNRRSPPEELDALFEKAFDADVVFVYATDCYYFPQMQATEVTCEDDWVQQLETTLSSGFKTVTSSSAANGRFFMAASFQAFCRISDVETSVACVPGPSGLSQATCIAVSFQVDNSTVAAVCVDLPKTVRDEATRWLILQALFQSLPGPSRASTGASASCWTKNVEWGERSCIDFLDRHNHVILLGDFHCPVNAPKLDVIAGLTRGKLDLVIAADSLRQELSRDSSASGAAATIPPTTTTTTFTSNNKDALKYYSRPSVLSTFSESDIKFPPTGPFLCKSTSNGRRIYDEDHASEPRWTCRVLWRPSCPPNIFDTIKPVFYGTTTNEITTSPHNPVISLLDLSTRRQFVDPMRRQLSSVAKAPSSCTKMVLTNIRVTGPIAAIDNPFLPSTIAMKSIPTHFNGGLVFGNPFFGPQVCASSVVEASNSPVWKDVLEVFIEGIDAGLFATTSLTATLSHVDSSGDYQRIGGGQYSLEALVGSSTKLLKREAMPLFCAGIRLGTLIFDVQLFLA